MLTHSLKIFILHLYSIAMHYRSSTSERHLLKLTTGGEHLDKYDE